MRRWALRILVFLLLGAIVNVAVAWLAVNTRGIWRDSLASKVAMRPSFLPPGSYVPGYVADTVHVEVGWPCKCLSSDYVYDAYEYRAQGDIAHQSVQDLERVFLLPSSLHVCGFAINTVFYAVVLWLLFAGPFVLRRRRRIRRGLCPKCAYDLRGRGSSSGACPECGSIVAL